MHICIVKSKLVLKKNHEIAGLSSFRDYGIQGRRKLPQSGWATKKIILLVVKSEWTKVPFQ